jgi:hypothetical protein|tara:strand:+ start:117 stop:647 length:531 start_codon:yes stop_codon:yes gene_type:complete
MVLRKLSKKVIYGSTLLGHYGRDLTDVTTTTGTYVNWGEQVDYTPVHGDSNMEVCVTGSAHNTGGDLTTSDCGGNCRIMINGEEEYLQENALSHRATQVGTRHYYNPRFSQHNARQQFTAQNFATGIYMTHMHQVRDTNQLEFQCMVNSTQSMSVTWGDGYMTLTELSVDQFGNTV